MNARHAIALGFDTTAVFVYPVELEPAAELELGTLGDATDAEFFALATQKLGGQVSAVEGQALQAMAGWGQDATSTLLANLDPNGQALFATAVQGAADLSHGINQQTLSAVAALAATEVAGPVAGAAVGGLLAGVQVAASALLGVAQTLGIAATAPPPIKYCGYMAPGVLVPWGPSDPGDGTHGNPGWIDSWAWIEKQIQQVPILIPGSGLKTVWVMPALQIGNNGCTAFYPGDGPTHPLIAPQVVIDGNGASLMCEYLQARTIEDSGGGSQFETLFVPLYFHNLDLANNCNPIAPLPLQVLLGKAVDVWNAAHEPGTPRTISAQPAAGFDYQSTISRILSGQFGGTSLPAITVNTGPAITPKKVIALHIPAGAVTAPAPVASSSSSAAGPVLAVGALAAASGGLWWYLGRPITIAAAKAAFRRLFR